MAGSGDVQALERRVREELARAQRYSLSFSVVLLDVDDLHALNDRYGPDMADRLRDQVAALLRRELRVPDFVGRYGGQEFALVLPETGTDGARRSIARVRERLAALPIDGAVPADRPRLSAGIVTYPHPSAAQPNDLFALLEAALKRAKAQVGERVGIAM